jgi:hypothetical protein
VVQARRKPTESVGLSRVSGCAMKCVDYTSARILAEGGARVFLSSEMMMRKLAFVVGGVAAGGTAALLTFGGTGPLAQQATS